MAKRPSCVVCGEPFGVREVKTEIQYFAVGEKAPPPRASNLKISRKRIDPHGTDRMAIRYDLWDGESYNAPYSPFCTLRCALTYARRAYAEKQGT